MLLTLKPRKDIKMVIELNIVERILLDVLNAYKDPEDQHELLVSSYNIWVCFVVWKGKITC